MSAGPATTPLPSPVSDLRDGRWHHVACTVAGAGGDITAYINGTQVATSTQGDTMGDDAGLLRIGWDGVSTYASGSLDEVALWNRALSAVEIARLYRRGANRIKFQVRSCSDSACGGGATPWSGPDGTNQSYFSELRNTLANDPAGAVQSGLPVMTFANMPAQPANNRYFQYRVILESDDRTGTSCDYGGGATKCSPELQSVEVGPAHYDPSAPSVSNVNPISYYQLTSLAETLGTGGCNGGIKYAVSQDNTQWKYWTGSAWSASNATAAQANPASTLSTQLPSFSSVFGSGSLYFKAFLGSNGTEPCELDSLNWNGTQ